MASTSPIAGVAAVVVTYNPDPVRSSAQFEALSAQVARIVVVDNGSSPATIDALRHRVSATAAGGELIELGGNRGIAQAQNVGIEAALAAGASHVLLMDHDSLPSADMVMRLKQALDRLEADGIRVAAVGPRYLDERQENPPPFIRVRGLKLHRLACPTHDTVNEVDYLIASGSLIPRRTLAAVGAMRAPLFIDYVDIEWGLRALALGYRSFGVCAATMDHTLGDEPIRFLGRVLPSHSPLRHYYHFRNAVWLYLHSDVPRRWKIVDAYRLVLRFGFYALMARPRVAHIRHMLRGIADGATGRLGPIGSAAGAAAPAGTMSR